jgi:hypothetical protein
LGVLYIQDDDHDDWTMGFKKDGTKERLKAVVVVVEEDDDDEMRQGGGEAYVPTVSQGSAAMNSPGLPVSI